MYLMLVLAGLALIVYLALQKLEVQQKRLPPGPFRWPVIGNLIDLALLDSKYIYNALAMLAAHYGEVMLIKTGVSQIVVVSGYEAIKEALCSECFLTRFSVDDEIHQMRSYGKPIGIANSSGTFWHQTRRFTVRHLKDFGFGQHDTLKVYCVDEYEALKAFWEGQMDSEKRVVVGPNFAFKISFSNLVWRTITSERSDLEDPERIQLVKGLDHVTKCSEFAGGVATAFPQLLEWFPNWFGKEEMKKQVQQVQKILEKTINKVKAQDRYKESPENFVEAFLQNIDRNKSSSDIAGIFTASTTFDLAWGSQDTLTGSLSHFLRMMLFHPEVQQKMRDEVNTVVEPGVRVTFDDKSKLHYCRAALLESQRIGNVTPIIGRKSWAKETSFRSFAVPANTTVVLNLLTVLQDETFWGDPENYRPERFLDANGDFVPCERVMTFGTGKRDCPGKAVAESGFFFYTCNLIRDYAVLPIPGIKYTMEDAVALTRRPKDYNVYLQKL